MPELPELEAFKSYVKKTSLKKKIIDVQFEGKKKLIQKISNAKFKKDLVGQKFNSVTRQGKYFIIKVSNGDYLVMHFGLTGSLAFEKDATKPIKFSKVTFIFGNHSALHWMDKRLFAKMWLVKNPDDVEGIKTLGIDATKITEKQFLVLAAKSSRKNVKAFLMDQELIAGIGNEYSDEILFQAGISPKHSVSDLSPAQLKKIYTEIHQVLRYFTTFRTKQVASKASTHYFTVQEVQGMKSTYLQAHRHTDGLCPKHTSHKLIKTKIAGRSAYYCPKDQK